MQGGGTKRNDAQRLSTRASTRERHTRTLAPFSHTHTHTQVGARPKAGAVAMHSEHNNTTTRLGRVQISAVCVSNSKRAAATWTGRTHQPTLTTAQSSAHSPLLGGPPEKCTALSPLGRGKHTAHLAAGPRARTRQEGKAGLLRARNLCQIMIMLRNSSPHSTTSGEHFLLQNVTCCMLT